MNRILLLTDDMPQGGAERQLSYLAIMFKQKGYDVRLIKFYPGVNFYQADLDIYGINTEIVLEGRNVLKRPVVIAKIVKEWKPIVVITYKDGTSIAACLAKSLTSFNLIVSERNTTQKLSHKEKIKFQLYRFADHIVPNSFSQKEFIEKHAKWLKSRIQVIINMIDTDKFLPSDTNKNTDIIQVVTMARIVPQKNILKYLDAVEIVKNKIPNVHFDWYGRIEDKDYYNKINDKLKRLNLEEVISFHDSTSNVLDVYNNADVFCLPSLYEGFPNVVCEAMSCGLTVVVSDVCDNPNIVLNSHRRFNPINACSIADSIINVITSKESVRKEEGGKNRKFIESLCSSNTFIESYLRLIEIN